MKVLKILTVFIIVMMCAGFSFAQDTELATVQTASDSLALNNVALDTLWVLFAAFLVFFMNLGFAMVEAGLQQAKNSVNISAKNFIVFAISSITFWFIGWGLMFGDGNGFMGYKGMFMMSGPDNSPAIGNSYHGVYSALNWTGVPLYAKFFFELVFCASYQL